MTAPGWPEKMCAFQDAIHWAAKHRGATVFRDSNQGGRVREANRVWLELHLGQIAILGVDEELSTVADDGERDVTLCGTRPFTMEVRAFSRDQDHDAAAWAALERAALRLRSSYAKEKWLIPNGISITELGPIINLPREWQNRIEDQALFEARMSTVVSDTDLANKGTWIDRVLVSSNLQIEGCPLDDAIQLDDELMGAPYPPPPIVGEQVIMGADDVTMGPDTVVFGG